MSECLSHHYTVDIVLFKVIHLKNLLILHNFLVNGFFLVTANYYLHFNCVTVDVVSSDIHLWSFGITTLLQTSKNQTTVTEMFTVWSDVLMLIPDAL